MVSSAAWVPGKSKTELKSATSAIPPDYWGPSSEQGVNGARFWRLETLETAVRQSQECIHLRCTSENWLVRKPGINSLKYKKESTPGFRIIEVYLEYGKDLLKGNGPMIKFVGAVQQDRQENEQTRHCVVHGKGLS
jgi:hypothetical protein